MLVIPVKTDKFGSDRSKDDIH